MKTKEVQQRHRNEKTQQDERFQIANLESLREIDEARAEFYTAKATYTAAKEKRKLFSAAWKTENAAMRQRFLEELEDPSITT